MQRIANARRIAGHETYGQATAIYEAFTSAHKNGIPKSIFTKKLTDLSILEYNL